MSPYTPKLIIPNPVIPGHPQRVGYLPLLLDGEEDIALDTED
jgi:hypothetical protein